MYPQKKKSEGNDVWWTGRSALRFPATISIAATQGNEAGPSKVAQAIRILSCILEVLRSNLGRGSNYPD
jgi:hypothetical protein